jgi:hypothetical protein
MECFYAYSFLLEKVIKSGRIKSWEGYFHILSAHLISHCTLPLQIYHQMNNTLFEGLFLDEKCCSKCVLDSGSNVDLISKP